MRSMGSVCVLKLCEAGIKGRMSWLLGKAGEENLGLTSVLIFLTVSKQGNWKRVSELRYLLWVQSKRWSFVQRYRSSQHLRHP